MDIGMRIQAGLGWDLTAVQWRTENPQVSVLVFQDDQYIAKNLENKDYPKQLSYNSAFASYWQSNK